MVDNNKDTGEACDLNEFASTMTKGIRRWEKVIYPMMIAFIILAAYGFWLIYNVTKDMRNISSNMIVMTKAVVTMTNTLNQKMNQIDHQMGAMNIHMDKLITNTSHVAEMNHRIAEMTHSIHNMNSAVTNMNRSVYAMVGSTSSMSSNLGELNDNISAPMNSMNSMIPWSIMPGQNKRRTNTAPPPVPRYNYPVTPYTQPRIVQPQAPRVAETNVNGQTNNQEADK